MLQKTLATLILALAILAPHSRAEVAEELANIQGSICEPELKGLADVAKVRNRRAVFVERFLTPWVKPEKILQAGLSPEETAVQLKKTNARGNVFQFEEFAKLYEDFFKGTKHEKAFVKILERSKRLEDALGFSSDADTFVRDFALLNADTRATQWAQKRADKGFKKLVKLLIDDGWIGKKSNALREMVELFREIKIPSQSEDADYLEKTLRKFIFDKIIKVDWDMTQLQTQLHELRRRERFLSLVQNAGRGKIALWNPEGVPIPQTLAELQNVPDKLKIFMKVDHTAFNLKNEVYFYGPANNALSINIDTWGTLKDRGELWDNSMEALIESGVFKDTAKGREKAAAWLEPVIKKAFPDWKPYLDDAYVELKKMRDSKFLELLFVPRTQVRGDAPASSIED